MHKTPKIPVDCRVIVFMFSILFLTLVPHILIFGSPSSLNIPAACPPVDLSTSLKPQGSSSHSLIFCSASSLDIPPSSQPRLFERLPERDNGSVAVIDVVIAGRIAAWQETMRSAELRYRCLLYRITAGTALSAPQQTCRAQPLTLVHAHTVLALRSGSERDSH
ncbi:hypothetical protein AOLI_G00199140 [Acnodon oligacanthus]